MPDDKKYQLSRRKALLGLGTIGVAGAAAGMGTSALFSDEETFEDNSITAGTTNLIVEAEVVASDSTAALEDTASEPYVQIVDSDGEVDGDAGVGIEAVDIKPGDSFVVCLSVTVEDNPMYVASQVENAIDGDGANPEPEDVTSDSDNIGSGTGPDGDSYDGEGNLDNKMDVIIGSDGDNDDTYDGSISTTEFSGSGTDYLNLRQLYRGSDGHGGPGADATELGGGDQVVHYIEFSLPASVGNEVQDDRFAWDVSWYAEQVRNNPEPTGPSQVIDAQGSDPGAQN